MPPDPLKPFKMYGSIHLDISMATHKDVRPRPKARPPSLFFSARPSWLTWLYWHLRGASLTIGKGIPCRRSLIISSTIDPSVYPRVKPTTIPMANKVNLRDYLSHQEIHSSSMSLGGKVLREKKRPLEWEIHQSALLLYKALRRRFCDWLPILEPGAGIPFHHITPALCYSLTFFFHRYFESGLWHSL